MSEKVVLAYSGGLDTSVAIKWLKEKYKLEVIALTVDVGNERDFSAIRQKALDAGAVSAGISGTGPATVILAEPEKRDEIVSALGTDDELIFAKINTEKARTL